jgi:hypothetical protein
MPQPDYEGVLVDALRHHFSGWHQKVKEDFGKDGFSEELQKLQQDELYSKWSLDSPMYVLIRLMGRMSISLGRRLGEIYDKIPRIVVAARFGLSPEEVSPTIEDLNHDIVINKSRLNRTDQASVKRVLETHFAGSEFDQGLGIEIRYNFNPNDSSRLRTDEKKASSLGHIQYFPVYLVFSSISPRAEAIARLGRAGWNFLQGKTSSQFMHDLVGVDLAELLERPKVKAQIKKEMNSLMQLILESPALKEATQASKT